MHQIAKAKGANAKLVMKWRVSRTWKVLVKSLFLWGISMDMCGKVCMRGNGIGKRNAEERRLLEFVMRESRAWQTLGFIRKTKEKLLIMLVDVKQIDFMLAGEKYRKCTRDVKVIPREIQHRLVAVDPDKNVLKKDCKKATDHEKKDLEAK